MIPDWTSLSLLVPLLLAQDEERPGASVWLESGPSERCVDVLVIGDGYQAEDLADGGTYREDVDRAAEQLFATPPFAWYESKFNVRFLHLESKDAGCDSKEGSDRVDTALDTTFGSKEKLALLVRNTAALRQIVEADGEADLVLVLVNVERRGASGLSVELPTDPVTRVPGAVLSARDPRSFRLALHALGHVFGWLNDEFVRSSAFGEPEPPPELPPGGPNIVADSAVLGRDFETLRQTIRWKHFLALPDADEYDWLHEGAGRRRKDYYRPWKSCLMREPKSPFCPICSEEIAKAILRACHEDWDDARYHAVHPLETWKDSG